MDLAGIDRLETVEAAEQGRFSRAGSADQGHDRAGSYLGIDAAQHAARAKALTHVEQANHRLRAHGSAPASASASCTGSKRRSMRRAQRASGKLIRKYSAAHIRPGVIQS